MAIRDSAHMDLLEDEAARLGLLAGDISRHVPQRVSHGALPVSEADFAKDAELPAELTMADIEAAVDELAVRRGYDGEGVALSWEPGGEPTIKERLWAEIRLAAGPDSDHSPAVLAGAVRAVATARPGAAGTGLH